MRGQRRAGLMPVAGADVQGAGGQARFGGDLRQLQKRQAGVFGGLDHAGVAGGQRRAHAAAEDLQGVVPGHDMAGDAVRFAHRQHRETRVVGNGLAVQLVDRAGIELEIAGHGGGVGARLLDGLAGVGRFQLRQFFLAVQQREGDFHEQAAARGGRHLAPLAVVSLAGRRHGAVHVGLAGTRDRLERLAIGRVQDGNGFTGGGGHPLVGDKVLLSHDVRSKVAAGRPVAEKCVARSDQVTGAADNLSIELTAFVPRVRIFSCHPGLSLIIQRLNAATDLSWRLTSPAH